MNLSVIFYPYHFVNTIFSIAFCPYHFVLEPLKLVEEERSLLTIIRTRQQKWMGHIMRGDSLQREIIEGRMEDKRGRGRPRQKLLDWMMSDGYLKKKLNIEKHGAIGGLDLPEGRELKEEEHIHRKWTILQ